MLFPIMFQPWYEKPDDRDGGGGADDVDDVDDEEVVDEEVEEEEEEFENEFAAFLAEEHPDLLEKYRDNTKGLLSALNKEREKAKQGKEAQRELKTYKDKEEEAQRKQRTTEENLQADLEAATKRAEKAENELLTLKRKTLVKEVAEGLHFRKPEDAVRYVDMGSLEIGDDEKEARKAIENTLKDVIKDGRKYLVEDPLGEDDNDTGDRRRRKLDDDPKSKKKVKEQQPKLAI